MPLLTATHSHTKFACTHTRAHTLVCVSILVCEQYPLMQLLMQIINIVLHLKLKLTLSSVTKRKPFSCFYFLVRLNKISEKNGQEKKNPFPPRTLLKLGMFIRNCRHKCHKSHVINFLTAVTDVQIW